MKIIWTIIKASIGIVTLLIFLAGLINIFVFKEKVGQSYFEFSYKIRSTCQNTYIDKEGDYFRHQTVLKLHKPYIDYLWGSRIFSYTIIAADRQYFRHFSEDKKEHREINISRLYFDESKIEAGYQFPLRFSEHDSQTFNVQIVNQYRLKEDECIHISYTDY